MGAPGERVQAGVDGELVTFVAPLRFSVDPGALRVLVPEGLPTDRQVAPLEAGLHAAQTLRRWLSPALAVQGSGSDEQDVPGYRRSSTTGRDNQERRTRAAKVTIDGRIG